MGDDDCDSVLDRDEVLFFDVQHLPCFAASCAGRSDTGSPYINQAGAIVSFWLCTGLATQLAKKKKRKDKKKRYGGMEQFPILDEFEPLGLRLAIQMQISYLRTCYTSIWGTWAHRGN